MPGGLRGGHNARACVEARSATLPGLAPGGVPVAGTAALRGPTP
ncbi:hypothetical protein OPKNFCMD_5513 [Methylobacterium crusticola]|uniref:Uncharacterized protein n=1 Tax=Methylobacterium crusticola TaxID=1697972 RepID=A0ABQ4R7J0_9HYPH|nr:hypothetical protein OPKNFCMD_5513 [Methylobacterium crusticola]